MPVITHRNSHAGTPTAEAVSSPSGSKGQMRSVWTFEWLGFHQTNTEEAEKERGAGHEGHHYLLALQY